MTWGLLPTSAAEFESSLRITSIGQINMSENFPDLTARLPLSSSQE